MNKRDVFINILSQVSNEKFTELIKYLEEQYNLYLESVESLEWEVPMLTKALESFETGEKFSFYNPQSGNELIFNPDEEDKDTISEVFEEAKLDLIKGHKIINVLSTFKDVFDNDPHKFKS